MNIWQRVEADQARGELWKARDRLTGAVRNQGADPAILDALAKVHFAMHDLPAAGKFWMLTDRNDDYAIEARDAFARSCGHDARVMLNALHIKQQVDAYPPVVQERLQVLIDQTTTHEMGSWLEPGKRTRLHKTVPTPPATLRDHLETALVVFATIGLWLVGLVAAIAAVVYGIARLF